MKTIILAGGCFWGVEKFFSLIRGVIRTEACYVNGNTDHTSYEEISQSGFAEGVMIQYDPSVIPLSELLTFYYQVIDPTSLNKQGNDKGLQYRTGIYYQDQTDFSEIEKSLKNLQFSYNEKIVVEVEPVKNLVVAEKYHQKYLDKNPNGYCHLGKDIFAMAQKTRE